MNEALSRLPSAPFAALGLSRTRHTTTRFTGPSFELLVPAEEPWLRALAEEVKNAWHDASRPIDVRPTPASQLKSRITSGNFDAALSFLATGDSSPTEVSRELFRWDGKVAPRGGRSLTPTEAARQLRLGVIGELYAAGYLANKVRHVRGASDLLLEDAELN
jgi:hypothetical protein